MELEGIFRESNKKNSEPLYKQLAIAFRCNVPHFGLTGIIFYWKKNRGRPFQSVERRPPSTNTKKNNNNKKKEPKKKTRGTIMSHWSIRDGLHGTRTCRLSDGVVSYLLLLPPTPPPPPPPVLHLRVRGWSCHLGRFSFSISCSSFFF